MGAKTDCLSLHNDRSVFSPKVTKSRAIFRYHVHNEACHIPLKVPVMKLSAKIIKLLPYLLGHLFQSNLSCCRLKWRCLMHFDASEMTTMLIMVFGSFFALFSIPENRNCSQHSFYYARKKYISTPVALPSSFLNTVGCRLLCRSLLFW